MIQKAKQMTAVLHPEFAEHLVRSGKMLGESPERIIADIKDIVTRRFREAMVIAASEEEGITMHLLVDDGIAVVFSLEDDELVLRGLGDPTTVLEGGGFPVAWSRRRRKVH